MLLSIFKVIDLAIQLSDITSYCSVTTMWIKGYPIKYPLQWFWIKEPSQGFFLILFFYWHLCRNRFKMCWVWKCYEKYAKKYYNVNSHFTFAIKYDLGIIVWLWDITKGIRTPDNTGFKKVCPVVKWFRFQKASDHQNIPIVF